ncbi:unnamed protein product [Notodromas monacha]|uniref:HEAT repeat-containing protein 6 n=1 Tax=Notodromas monacha TaxID=399045 RepID=A0A7R9BVE6_9CRUS|nr:unnamed protein product [Notodromas monacha]CAG0921401.1 unnamed protein product [Notodromas monacha]
MSFSRPDLRQLEQQFISKREDYEKLLKSWVLAEKSVLAVIGDHGIPGVKRLEAQRCLHAFLRLSFVETKAVALGDKVEFRRYFDHILGSFSYKPSVGEDSIVLAKICKLGLKSLQLLLTSGVGVDPVAHLLGTLTHLCSYGLPGYRFQIPPPIVPSSLGKVDVEEIETAAESSKSFTASKITKRSRGGRKKAGKHAKENNPKPGESKPEKRDPRFWSEDPTEWLAENSLNPMATTTWRNTKTWLTNIESSSSSTGNGVPSSVLISSDSEVSDVETKPKESEARVRRESLEALRAAFKCLSKEAVTSYWWAFMPRATEGRLTTNTTITSGAGNESIDNDCWTLVSALVREPSCKCRFSAAVALDHYLKQCKLFIAVGEERRGTQAFTPFAVELGESLMEVHKGLRLAVAQETSPITLIQILNTINTLVALTPFRRFAHAGLLKALVSDIKKFLAPQNRMNQFGGGSNSLAVGVLTVLGTMIRCHPNVKEVEEVLCESLDDESWVVVHCCGRVLEALSAEEDGGKVKPIVAEVIQCLGVLNEVCKHYPTHLIGRDQEHWPDLKRILVKGLASPQIQLHVAKFIPTVASVLMLGKNLTDGQPAAWETLSAERQEKFWLELLSGPLPTLFQKLDLACLRASACDCLAAIGDSVLESLPSRMRLMCLSLLVGQAYDELPTARASAIRGLGIYVLLPSLMEDDSFVLDVCNAVKAGLNSESHTVKVNAAWALGNVTDALVAWTSREKRGECESLDNVVPLNVYLDILNEAVLGTEEKHNFKVYYLHESCILVTIDSSKVYLSKM